MSHLYAVAGVDLEHAEVVGLGVGVYLGDVGVALGGGRPELNVVASQDAVRRVGRFPWQHQTVAGAHYHFYISWGWRPCNSQIVVITTMSVLFTALLKIILHFFTITIIKEGVNFLDFQKLP